MPYRLKIVTKFGVDIPKNGKVYQVLGISHKPDSVWNNGGYSLFFETAERNKEYSNAYFDFKPILRPISDLHCDFEIDNCNVYNSLSARSRNDLNYITPTFTKWSYEDFSILLKHHFDVFELIPAGLAVSIHDVGQVVA